MTPFFRSLFVPAALLLLSPLAMAQTVTPGSGGTSVGPTEIEVPTGQSDRESLILLLSGYHGLPEASVFEARFSDPRAQLLALLGDPALGPIHYDRALAGLAYWPNDEVRAVYETVLQSTEREMVVHRVIGHLVQGFGDVAIERVTPYLSADDVQLRLTAVQALSTLATPLAFEALDARLTVEPSDLVRTRIVESTRLR
ncbi:MAG: hypothetical protein ACI81R_002152 [Bradymonadia bacterium]|jgi:hypothetical protein